MFERYFPDIDRNTYSLIRDPFKVDVDACLRDDQYDEQEKLHLKHDSRAQNAFGRLKVTQFWCSMLSRYRVVINIALKLLRPFPLTYLCELAFLKMLSVKSVKSTDC